MIYWLKREWLKYSLRVLAHRRAELRVIVEREYALIEQDELALNQRLRELQSDRLNRGFV